MLGYAVRKGMDVANAQYKNIYIYISNQQKKSMNNNPKNKRRETKESPLDTHNFLNFF